HVFGKPSLFARHARGDAQREAFLAEQRVATIPRSKRPDLPGLRVVDDVLRGVARPTTVHLAGLEWGADGMYTRHKLTVLTQDLHHVTSHARHRAHVDGDVGAVADLNADMRDRATNRAHRERDHVHRAAPHAALEEACQSSTHGG